MAVMLRAFFLIISVTIAWGCATPTSMVHTVDDRPGLGIVGASPTSRLLINGLDMGLASDYDGEKAVLRLESGTHQIVVLDENRVYYDEKVYLGRGIIKKISIGGSK